jgi:hypothetical protein
MIVRNIDTVRNFIDVNDSLTYAGFKKHLLASERKHIKALIGDAQYAVFDVETLPTDAKVLEAYYLAQETICNFALYYYLPFIKSQISEAGIFTSQSENTATASDKDFKELQRSCKRQAHETLDEFLKVLESNLTKFTAWTADDSFKRYNNTLVHNTETFNKHYNIFNSRQTFMALKPEIEVAERQYVNAVIGKDLLIALKTKQTNENRIEAKELIEKSIVSFTVAKVMQNGMFMLKATGITAKFDVLPYESIRDISTDFLKETQKNKIAEAEQLLKLAVATITANAIDFTEYTAPDQSTASEQKIIVTKGITMI